MLKFGGIVVLRSVIRKMNVVAIFSGEPGSRCSLFAKNVEAQRKIWRAQRAFASCLAARPLGKISKKGLLETSGDQFTSSGTPLYFPRHRTSKFFFSRITQM